MIMMINVLISCTQVKPTDVIVDSEDGFDIENYLKEREFCLNKLHPNIRDEVIVPTPITLSEKRRFAENRSHWMTLELLEQRLLKNNIYHFFKSDFESLDRRSDGYGDLVYRYNKDFLGSYSSIRVVGMKMDFITYNFSSDKYSHTITDQERQEVLPLINVVVDDWQKSAQILSELEEIYQDKLARKELLALGTIVANVEYQGELFELRGNYYIDKEDPKCSLDSVAELSIA